MVVVVVVSMIIMIIVSMVVLVVVSMLIGMFSVVWNTVNALMIVDRNTKITPFSASRNTKLCRFNL